MWHITFAPVPAFSQAWTARLSGSSPCRAMTFSDIRTLMPMTMSAFSATALAATSTWAKSMLNSSGTGKLPRPILAICTNAYRRVRVWATMYRRNTAKLLAPASPAETTVVVPWNGTSSSAGMPMGDP
jgi:hypothetical protein